MRRWLLVIPILASALADASAVHAGRQAIAGPVEAEVLEVIDGDTFLAEAHIWPGHSVTVSVRIRGIDAPEMRARCPAEKLAAIEARDVLAGLIGDRPVRVSNIGGGKYYGRVLADVTDADGRSLGGTLLSRWLVLPYAGGRRDRAVWCGRGTGWPKLGQRPGDPGPALAAARRSALPR